MPFDLKAADYMLPGAAFVPKPYITGWNRLEGRVRQEDFARALRAEARDPMWFLARQWQFLELEGDDAGSPIEARWAVKRRRIERFAVKGGEARHFSGELPLEAAVEREPVPFDRLAIIQAVRAFAKALESAGHGPADRAKILAGMRAAYPLAVAAIAGVADEEALQLGAAVDAFLFDAEKLLGDPAHEASIDARAALSPGLAVAAKQAVPAVRLWWKRLYLLPEPGENAWEPSTLDYRFRCATAPGADQLVLEGDGYANGSLDWFSLDAAKAGEVLEQESEGAGAGEDESSGAKALSFLPSAIRFAGMPSHRFWEMEDAKVELGSISAATTDIAKILLSEFILAYGNDWCLVPLELQVGELCDTLGLVSSEAGIGIDGEQFARSQRPKPEADPPPAPGATARYRLGTDAPRSWRPFIPAHVPGSNRSVQLQRARLPDGDPDPYGAILVGPGVAPERYFIAEEEVPRAGRIVTRAFQRTRWLDGRVLLWLGRQTETGRGEGTSGLEFDVIEEVPQR